MCRMTTLSGNPNRAGLTGQDRQRTPADLRPSRWSFLLWNSREGGDSWNSCRSNLLALRMSESGGTML